MDIKDSGDRTEFTTGAVRDMHEGKGRFDLIPACVEVAEIRREQLAKGHSGALIHRQCKAAHSEVHGRVERRRSSNICDMESGLPRMDGREKT